MPKSSEVAVFTKLRNPTDKGARSTYDARRPFRMMVLCLWNARENIRGMRCDHVKDGAGPEEQVWIRKRCELLLGEGSCRPRVILTSFSGGMCCRTVCVVGLILGFLDLSESFASYLFLCRLVGFFIVDVLFLTGRFLTSRCWFLSLNQTGLSERPDFPPFCNRDLCYNTFTCEDTEPGIRQFVTLSWFRLTKEFTLLTT